MIEKLTPRQRKYLWAFETRHTIEQPHTWAATSKKAASALIGACIKYEQGQMTATTLMALWHAAGYNLQLKGAEPEPKPEPKPEPEPEKAPEPKPEKPTLPAGLEFDQAIEWLIPHVGGITALQDLYNAKPPTVPQQYPPQPYVKPPEFDLIFQASSTKGVNVLIKGPAGSGKSLLGRELSTAHKLEFFCFSCSGGMRYAHVFGSDKLSIDPETKQTISEFKLSNLMLALQKPTLVLLDEFFALDPDILIGLNGLFEPGTRSIEVKEHGAITMHPDCIVIAAANTDGRNIDRNHAGAKRVDGSSLDRFVTFELNYSDAVEKALCEQLPKLVSKDIQTWLASLRNNLAVNNISFDPSTRRLNTCIKLCKNGMPHVAAFTCAFLGQLSTNERQKLQMGALAPTTTTTAKEEN